MSADNEVIIRRKQNGLYEIKHCSASSLVHALNDLIPTEDELTLNVVANDVDGLDNAIKKAEDWIEEYEEKGGIVEYGYRVIE